ncbi:hypothetical protein, partial [Streptomyces anandii]|uniref:hypothetical protein n=1 Tax=Streptomyces anandii TaxID=285454 RepID=UPI0036C7912B
MGAPESNAGDDFHFWWAASRALKLVEPGTILQRVTLEGLAHVDDPDEYETVDVAEYLGGDDADSADALVLSQLKYSSRHPDTEWTTARLCKKSVRYRANLDLSRGSADGVGGPFRFPELTIGRPTARLS